MQKRRSASATSEGQRSRSVGRDRFASPAEHDQRAVLKIVGARNRQTTVHTQCGAESTSARRASDARGTPRKRNTEQKVPVTLEARDARAVARLRIWNQGARRSRTCILRQRRASVPSAWRPRSAMSACPAGTSACVQRVQPPSARARGCALCAAPRPRRSSRSSTRLAPDQTVSRQEKRTHNFCLPRCTIDVEMACCELSVGRIVGLWLIDLQTRSRIPESVRIPSAAARYQRLMAKSVMVSG